MASYKTINLYSAFCGYRCGNSGDISSKEIIEKLFKRKVYQHDQKEEFKNTSLVAAGSIAQDIPYDYEGFVWGTGSMFEHQRIDTPNATVCAVRGYLSAARWMQINKEKIAIGDPGLLVSRIFDVSQQKKRYRVGIIPHYIDADNMILREYLRKNPDATSIDVCMRLEDVIKSIAECELILSSSLHGLIFAEAINVPNLWIYLSDKIQGGSFKFRDYYSIFGITDPLTHQLSPEISLHDLFELKNKYWFEKQNLESIKDILINNFPQKLLQPISL